MLEAIVGKKMMVSWWKKLSKNASYLHKFLLNTNLFQELKHDLLNHGVIFHALHDCIVRFVYKSVKHGEPDPHKKHLIWGKKHLIWGIFAVDARKKALYKASF